MKLSKSLATLLTLICITVIVVTTFRLSPSFARSTPVMSAEVSAEKVTTDLIAQVPGGNSLYTRLGGYNPHSAPSTGTHAVGVLRPSLSSEIIIKNTRDLLGHNRIDLLGQVEN
ncbi:hypothetical protein Osc7112_2063 [Oscillatoria nigro-viridis PCC 7112]|uniref:Uncharacterized protein n=1 Tax=Phormidium nigroviride PCC 7112 TaxID=179408 RepID=K9VEN3_9CYAN|nr:hypothetical protein [Oscillatoria nigro-viridis]AFZ06533.1 hypothetical protein Osc7112_2063 [Oscillatoria nigro-viridis PCC 7112]